MTDSIQISLFDDELERPQEAGAGGVKRLGSAVFIGDDVDVDTLSDEIEPDAVPFLFKAARPEVLAAPAPFLRSSLFGMVRKGARLAVEDFPISCYAGVEMTYSGEQLGQSDLAVWMGMVNMSNLAQSETVVASANFFCKEIIRRQTHNWAWLWEHANRLYDAKVALSTGRVKFLGRLIDSVAQIEQKTKTGKSRNLIRFKISEDAKRLFTCENVAFQNSEVRVALTGDFARWMYGYLMSHEASHRIHILKLKKMSGAGCDERKFRFNLRQTMADLESHGIVKTWDIRKDVLFSIRSSNKPNDDPLSLDKLLQR